MLDQTCHMRVHFLQYSVSVSLRFKLTLDSLDYLDADCLQFLVSQAVPV